MQDWLRSGPESPTLAPRKPKSASRVGSPPEWEMPAGLYHVGVVARHLDKGIETKRNEFAIRTK